MVSVANKVAVVTGGRRGLGAAIVDELLARGVSKVYSTARTAYADDRPRVVTVPLDVRSADSVAALAEIAADAEIVFNNAGVLLPATLLNGEFADIAETFEVNVFGPLRVARAFAPILAAHGGGALVNMHSVLSWLAGSGAYGASKAFDMVFAEALWAELHPAGVDVIGLILGKTDTPALRALEHARGVLPSPETRPADAATAEEVVAEALDNLGNGPTVLVGEVMKAAAPMLGSMPRRQAVELLTAAGAATMG